MSSKESLYFFEIFRLKDPKTWFLSIFTQSKLIKSYLTNRYQYVHFESCRSDLLEIKTGIPQGSILGPLFFSILINNIVNSSSKLSFLMYADDTTIYFNLEDFSSLNRELEKVNTWFQLNN